MNLRNVAASVLLALASLFIGPISFAAQGTLCLPTTGVYGGLTAAGYINAATAALVSANSGSTAPTNACGGTPVAGQMWLDTSTTPNTLRVYDGSSSNWLAIGGVDSTNHRWTPTVGGGLGTLASSATTDLGSVPQAYVSVTGTTTITALGSTAVAGSVKFVRFAGALTLTYNASSLILPGAANITTVAGDSAIALALGSGNWAILSYIKADGTPVIAVPFGTLTNLASAATTDLGTIASHNVNVTGTTTITSFGSSAGAGNPVYNLVFAGALTLTQNATSLILPGAANIVTAAGDTANAMYLGSGNWQVIDYTRAAAAPNAGAGFASGRLFYVSSTQVCFKPYKGNAVMFPSGGISFVGSSGVCSTITSASINGIAGQTLSASTLYYGYLWNNAGTLTLDWSTSGHATDTTTGIEIKSGDATRVLEGMVYPTAGPIFQDGLTNRLVASWNNRLPRKLANSFTAIRSTASSTYVEINTEIRVNFLSWGDATQIAYSGVETSNSGADQVYSAPSLDGAITGTDFFPTGGPGTSNGGISSSGTCLPSEGFHYVTLVGRIGASTANWLIANGSSVLSAMVVN